MTLVRQDDLLRKRFELLVSIPGIAQVSAMQLLAELSTMPPDLTVREWVAHSGLDPAHEISGSSVRKASRISRAGNRHLEKSALHAGPDRIPLRSPRKGLFREPLGSKQSPPTGAHCCCEEVAPRHIWDLSKRPEV
jgi:transposase